ncbi:hypothetical protein N9I86_06190, partial [Hyphomicrobiales bacterium]|nr:hypothetical protein [Hyphomicrobiales bacterium]
TNFSYGSTTWLFAAIYFNLMNNIREGEDCIKKSLVINPGYGEAHRIYSDILKKKHDKEGCLKHALIAVEINSNNASAYDTLGTAYALINDHKSAEKSYIEAIGINSNSAVIFNNLGNTQRHLGKYNESINSFNLGLKLSPDIIELYNNLALTFFEIDEYEKAYNTLKSAEKKSQFYNSRNLVDLYTSYGHINSKLHKNREAIEYYKKALKLNKYFSSANNGLGEVYTNLREFDKAIKSFKNALKNSPYLQGSISNYLLCYNYLMNSSADAKFKKTIEYANLENIKKKKIFQNIKNKNKKLKLGFVSGDFYHHPVSYFLINPIRNLDKDKFETFAYSNYSKTDSFTDILKSSFTSWRDIFSLNNTGVLELIEKDGIDILFDLSGYTARNSLKIFKSKASPIQVSWLGYSGTSGIKEIDYILADEISIPKNEEKWFVEKPLRMPNSYYCFSDPFKDHVEITARKNKTITFGCFNNVKKLNNEVLDLWSEIIYKIPNSIIIFKCKSYIDSDVRKSIRDTFLKKQIEKERIIFLNSSPRKEYLKDYNKIDITLDPFPYPGGTTTCESLYMGVPVIALKGNDFLSRNSENILKNSDLIKYIAKNKKEYIDIAISIAKNDSHRIKELIRNKFLKSPLMDGTTFSKDLSLILREVWKKYCDES